MTVQMRDNKIKELRDAKIVTTKHVDTQHNLADRLTKGVRGFRMWRGKHWTGKWTRVKEK